MVHTFDIDNYLNPFIPAPRLDKLPYWISRFLGYRPLDFKPYKNQWLNLASVFLSTFTGLLIVLITFNFSKFFIAKGAPVIIPSLGASSILIYNAVGAPLAQPRNLLVGTFVSSFIGIVIMKLFMTHPSKEEFLWLGAALSTAASSVVMSLLDCVHPPAGAAALLPLVDDQIRLLGWYYLPVQLISMGEMLFIALLFNNVVLRYPVYWWTGKSLEKIHRRPTIERIHKQPTIIDEMRQIGEESEDEELNLPWEGVKDHYFSLKIAPNEVHLPPDVEFDEETAGMIRSLQARLQGLEYQYHHNNNDNRGDDESSLFGTLDARFRGLQEQQHADTTTEEKERVSDIEEVDT